MRNDEQKSQDIIMHEKRYRAEEILAIIKKRKRKALVVGAIAAVAAFAILISFILSAYHSQNVPLTVGLIAVYFVVVALAYYVAGAVLSGGATAFFRALSLLSKWNDAIADFDAISDKVAECTAMPGDMEKYEEKLVTIAEAVASYGEKYGL